MMIAIGIFSIFLMIMAGVFSRFVQTERHHISEGSLTLDLQSAIESFIKEARTGYGSTYLPEGGTKTAFRNQSGICVSYRVNGSGIFQRAENPSNTSGDCNSGQFGDAVYTPLTGEGTFISDVLFDVAQSVHGSEDYSIENQGVITLTLTANPVTADPLKKSTVLPITIQNTVTSRQLKAYDASE